MSEWEVTEVGLFPKEWKLKTLDKYIQESRGICYGIVQPGFHDENGIPIIRVNNLKNGRIVPNDALKVSAEIESQYSRSRLRGNEILISLVGNVGEIVIVDSQYQGWNVARAIGVVPVNDAIDKAWLKYWLQSDQIQQYIKTRCNTTVQITLNLKDVSALPILTPSLEEQRQIAQVPSAIDRKISNLRQQNETLEAIAQTLFKHWFVDFEFPNEDGKPYKSSGGEMGRSELGEIPVSWRIGTFEEFFNLFSGGTPKTSVSEYWNGDVKWLSGKDVTSHHKNFIIETERTISILGLNNSAAKLLPQYTTVISARGTVGSCCILSESMAISQTNFGVLAKQEEQRFYGHLLIASLIEKLKGEAYGSVFDTITTSNFKRLYILIPDLSTVNCFEDCISRIFTKILLNSKQIETLTKARDRLLPKLMSGQLRITEL